MKIFNVTVANKIATYQKRDGDIVCGNSDYQIKFTFDSEWDAYETKTARIVAANAHYDVEFQGDTCNVPVISNANQIYVGVYAGEVADGESILTTTIATIPCIRSIRCGNTIPSADTGENYTNLAKGYATQAQEAAETATKAMSTIDTDYFSAGVIQTNAFVNESGGEDITLYLDFSVDDVEYTGIVWHTSEMVGSLVDYIQKDTGNRVMAYGPGYWELSNKITIKDKATFAEIYSTHQNYFTYEEIKGIRMGGTYISEEKANNFAGLEVIAEYPMQSLESFEGSMVSSLTSGNWGNSAFGKARFIGIDGTLFPIAVKTGVDLSSCVGGCAITITGEGYPYVLFPSGVDSYGPITFTLYR